jgi:RimJ/RimL family protein N-acetyltransferase
MQTMRVPEIRTDRLQLRAWRESDREPFAALNADPVVAEFLGGPIDREASDAMQDRFAGRWVENGYGLWAVERIDNGDFIGFTGLSAPTFDTHFIPAVEVGWRLASGAWGQGFATEAAQAALQFGFLTVGLEEIVSFTVPANQRSRRVMEKLGMTRAPEDDFDHPRIPDGDPLRRHVLYRLSRERWERSLVR